MVRGTLIVREIINLTDEGMWMYDEFGNLIELKPENIRRTFAGEIRDPLPFTYYYAEGALLEVLKADERYQHLTVSISYSGQGPNDKKVFKFINEDNKFVVPSSNANRASASKFELVEIPWQRTRACAL